MIDWKPMAELPEGHRDGRQLLCTDGVTVRVCVSNRTQEKAFEIVHGLMMLGKQRFWMIPTHWAMINLPGQVEMLFVPGTNNYWRGPVVAGDPIQPERRFVDPGMMIPVSEALRTDEDAAP